MQNLQAIYADFAIMSYRQSLCYQALSSTTTAAIILNCLKKIIYNNQ